MRWSTLLNELYSLQQAISSRRSGGVGSGAAATLAKGGTPEEALRGATWMPEYRDFVEAKAKSDGPSEIIFNRNAGHAVVVLDVLFRVAQDHVNIVTSALSPDVYGQQEVIDSAVQFMRNHPAASLKILAENPVDRKAHPLLSRLDSDSAIAARITLRYIPTELRNSYTFNFAVADGVHYRFEETRLKRQAYVQFGESGFGGKLENTFQTLFASSIDELGAA